MGHLVGGHASLCFARSSRLIALQRSAVGRLVGGLGGIDSAHHDLQDQLKSSLQPTVDLVASLGTFKNKAARDTFGDRRATATLLTDWIQLGRRGWAESGGRRRHGRATRNA